MADMICHKVYELLMSILWLFQEAIILHIFVQLIIYLVICMYKLKRVNKLLLLLLLLLLFIKQESKGPFSMTFNFNIFLCFSNIRNHSIFLAI
jgi:hypothetical protein